MATPQYGGWVSFTAHLALKHKLPLYKIGNTTEYYKDGTIRTRDYGYGVEYQNIAAEDIEQIGGKRILITAIDKHYYEHLDKFPTGTYIVIHDPTEVSGTSAAPLLKHLQRFRVVTIRKSVQDYLKGHLGIKSKYILHPFYEYDYEKSKHPSGAVSISRIDFDKHTDIILRANTLLPESKAICIYGAINRQYVFFKLKDIGFTKYYKGKFNKSFEDLSDLLKDVKFVVDMSIIKNDGGGTQYTFLEAIYQECILVINKKWVNGGATLFKDGVNCFVVEDEKELAAIVLKENNMQSIIRNAHKILEPHISVDWIREMNAMR